MLISEIVVHRFAEFLEHLTVGLIVEAETALLLDGLALVVEIIFGDVEAAHAVSFEIQKQVELIAGQRLEIKGAFFIGRAIHLAAVGLNQNEMLALADVLRALVHHVLEEMRESGSALSFVARAGVVNQRKRDDRRAVVFHPKNPKTILELRLLDFKRATAT